MQLEKFADETDRASALDMVHQQESVLAARLRAAPQQVPNEQGEYAITECVDCGEGIIEARLKHGFIRCVDCAERKEKREGGRW